RVEHVLQYREDEQTHLLPGDPSQRARLAAALGMDADAFETTLAAHRGFVSRIFRNAFRLAGVGGDDAPGASPCATPGCPAPAADDAESRLAMQIRQAFGDEADDLLRRAESLLDSHRI